MVEIVVQENNCTPLTALHPNYHAHMLLHILVGALLSSSAKNLAFNVSAKMPFVCLAHRVISQLRTLSAIKSAIRLLTISAGIEDSC